MYIKKRLLDILVEKKILWFLFLINFLGTIYGYIWYKEQLLATNSWLWPFVPDSPTASLFFTIVLLGFLLNKKFKLLEAFAAVTLFKYGIWATVMIIWTGVLGGELNWQHYMLIFSHLGMAVQALLYAPFFSFNWKHLLIVGIWTITNDVLDYTLGIFPWLHYLLHPFLPIIYSFTVILSILSLSLFYILTKRRNKNCEI
ncbi:MAG: DUF1405 domain-containing protein [Bacillaceae bacterium]|nr:DUF1405 domain-containing protein [Bacillaceae bacterium]